MTFCAELMGRELSNSRYSRHVIASGNGFGEFEIHADIALFGVKVWASEAPCSGLRRKRNMKYISFVI